MGQERETSFSSSRESRVSSRESISKFEEKGRGERGSRQETYFPSIGVSPVESSA